MFADVSSLVRRDLDAAALRALAHPLRQRILYHLAFVGPANSTAVAKALGESTGSTSYHLRQLARAGMIEEDEQRSGGRERWWRLIPLDLRASESTAGGQSRTLAAEVARLRLNRDRDLVTRYLAVREQFGDWQGAAMFSSSATRLTRDELVEFTERYVELLKSYWRPPEDCPPDATPIAALFYAFPWPGEPSP